MCVRCERAHICWHLTHHTYTFVYNIITIYTLDLEYTRMYDFVGDEPHSFDYVPTEIKCFLQSVLLVKCNVSQNTNFSFIIIIQQNNHTNSYWNIFPYARVNISFHKEGKMLYIYAAGLPVVQRCLLWLSRTIYFRINFENKEINNNQNLFFMKIDNPDFYIHSEHWHVNWIIFSIHIIRAFGTPYANVSLSHGVEPKYRRITFVNLCVNICVWSSK